MFSSGANIKNNTEPLKKVSPEYLYNALRFPKPDYESRIRQLRVVRQLNYTQYSALKQQLPYFVCAVFNPPFRKTENFAYTEYFILDIDNVGEKGLVLENLRFRIQADPRTFLCFMSPGEDGLKVIMKLKERCYDAGVYSLFYKRFVHGFSEEYGLQQVLDSKTCDVTRACFMSVDRDAYYNPCCEPVDLSSIVADGDTSEMLRQKADEEKMSCDAEVTADSETESEKAPKDPDADAMSRIKELLRLKARKPVVEKPVFVPEVLDAIQSELTSYVNDMGFVVTGIIDIQYGKKIRVGVGLKKAEVNLFYGKRGFSVVVSPKTGTDDACNDLLASAVRAFINER